MKCIISYLLFMVLLSAPKGIQAQSELDSLKKQITIDSLRHVANLLKNEAERDKPKFIPDRVIETGLPALLILVFFYVALSIIRINALKAVKMKMIEKGLPEDMLKQLFTFSKTESMFGALKWGIVLAGIGGGTVIAYFLPFGLMTFGIVTLSAALGFYIYYRLLKSQL